MVYMNVSMEAVYSEEKHGNPICFNHIGGNKEQSMARHWVLTFNAMGLTIKTK